ncbi:YqjK family protein [Vreelandella sulfidaeris]|uniref:YqjK family protein n=1 Tax=Vreelandella sulfidaeris TaxID=115553 RepID=UPI0035EB971B|tara:strand:+ start:2534 stop:2833 length:300 start_codon:yes stop_codon:yes gene_type:complete
MKPSADTVKPPTRAQRKAQLLAELEQQRVDILVDSEYLQLAASPLDKNWQSFRLPLYVAGGVAAYKLIRHPGGAMVAGRKALAGYMLLKKLKLLAKVAT